MNSVILLVVVLLSCAVVAYGANEPSRGAKISLTTQVINYTTTGDGDVTSGTTQSSSTTDYSTSSSSSSSTSLTSSTTSSTSSATLTSSTISTSNPLPPLDTITSTSTTDSSSTSSSTSTGKQYHDEGTLTYLIVSCISGAILAAIVGILLVRYEIKRRNGGFDYDLLSL